MEFHLGELFPRLGFIVTNLETDSRAVLRFYMRRQRSMKCWDVKVTNRSAGNCSRGSDQGGKQTERPEDKEM
jgi:hypothetical protein